VGQTDVQVLAGLLALGIFVVPGILYLLTLQRALERCSLRARTISPGQVWLMLIPAFNLIWHFFLVNHLARSLRNEFVAREMPDSDREPGKGVGLAMCILGATSIIPVVGVFTGLAGFVCWIIYWVKISGYSRQLGAPAPYTTGQIPPPEGEGGGYEQGFPESMQGEAIGPQPQVRSGMPKALKIFLWVVAGWFGLIIAITIALPIMSRSAERSKEMATIAAIRTIHTSEVQYYSQYGRYATSLAELGPPTSGAPGPAAADLIDATLASGTKNRYQFTLTGNASGYVINVVTELEGRDGRRTFYSDQTMVIRQNYGSENATANSPELK
jgi:type IV pilus assembly protein PilA